MDCNDYDVIEQIIYSVGKLDVDRCVRSLQLNPRCIPLSADDLARLSAELARYQEQDRQLVAAIHAQHAKQVALLAAQGQIPVLTRDLAPAIYDRVVLGAKSEWRRRHPSEQLQPGWEESEGFRRLFTNMYYNALRRSTPYQVRQDAGGKTYVAQFSQCTVYTTLVRSGHREFLQSETVMLLLDFFLSHGALNPAEVDDLWARFSRRLEMAMTAKARMIAK